MKTIKQISLIHENKKFLVLIFLLSFSFSCFSIENNFPTVNQLQNTKKDSTFHLYKNSIYIELLGVAFSGGSINYERTLLHDNYNNTLNVRTGFGYGYSPYTLFYSFPFILDGNIAISKSVYLEIGPGISYVHSTYYKNNPEYSDEIWFVGNAGFKFIIAKHLLFRIDVTPFLLNKDILPILWFGVSLGGTF